MRKIYQNPRKILNSQNPFFPKRFQTHFSNIHKIDFVYFLRIFQIQYLTKNRIISTLKSNQKGIKSI